MLVTATENNLPAPRPDPPRRPGFFEDFRRFFLRGLATLLPTLITLWLVVWIWSFLWDALGRHIIAVIKWAWAHLASEGKVQFQPRVYIDWYWQHHLSEWQVQLIGVGLAIVLVYIVGLLVGNYIGRAAWRLAEVAFMRIPFVRAIYPAAKQVTDFVLAERRTQVTASRVVAVQHRAQDVWTIGLVTGAGLPPLSDRLGEEMVTVFVPSTPTAFSGYVVVVPRDRVIELPLTVEQAMRLLVSGGVVMPGAGLPGAGVPGGHESDTPDAGVSAGSGGATDRSGAARR